MNSIVSLKNFDTRLIKGKLNINNLLESQKKNRRKINTAKLIKKSSKYKDFFYERKKLLMNKTQSERFFSTRKEKYSINNQKLNIKSAIYKIPINSQRSIYSSIMSKTTKSHKITNTNSYSFFLQKYFKNKNKRNYSAYYINSNLSLKKSYISDLLIPNEENIQNKTQKISDIEKKISLLEKKLNLKSAKNNKSNSFFNSSKKEITKREKEEEKNEKEKNLPDYLREEFKIKGTNILSPFCMKSRDKFIMEKFWKFLNKNNTLKTDKKSLVDNKLNIVYAENEEMYQKKLRKINNDLVMQGKRERYKYYLSPSERQLRDMEKKVTFMKDIVEVAFPNTAMIKIRDNRQYFKKNKTNYKKFESMYDKGIEDYKNNFYEIKFK